MKHKMTTFIVVSTITSFGVYHTSYKFYSSGMSENDIYLRENIEALSDAENNKETAKCGTKEEIVNGYPCPVHPSIMIGFRGTEYSYSTIGSSTKYRTGQKGNIYSCIRMGCSPLLVDNVQECSCSSK